MASEQEGHTLIPVEQEELTFYGKPLVAVRLADDRICVVLRWLCDSLGLEPTAQVRRIKRTKAITNELISVRAQTASGEQTMPSLTLRALPFWLAGIDTSRLDPAMEPVILAYQREVVEVLYQHFAQKRQALAVPPSLVPAEPILKPETPAQDAPPDAWLAYHEQMVIWLRWRQDIETWREEMEGWQGSVENRLESVEALAGLVPEILERMGPTTLSPEHQRTVQASVNRLHDLTGQTHAAIYDELREHFRVGTYKEIPESRWADVAAWFQARTQRAQRQSGH
ncbi:MAG TPA: phage antirepressor N-terminal domain-containing protein [Ktedonobacterales bacterium]|nr:phage antirepressor N-terminal domain-containing protein [Ktedonobacterales bacterium]